MLIENVFDRERVSFDCKQRELYCESESFVRGTKDGECRSTFLKGMVLEILKKKKGND